MTKPVQGHFHRHAPKTSDLQERWDEKVMSFITRKVGTLACAIIFALIALTSVEQKFSEGTKGIVEWTAQTFLQLVLLSIILGGQSVSEKANDAQTSHISLGIDTALNQLDTKTEGGLKDILEAIESKNSSH